MGRFISEDPLFGNLWDPQSLNRFVYARNNPFRFTDPTGKESFDDLNDPDGRKYSVNKRTGEIRYKRKHSRSRSENEQYGSIARDDDKWSDWKDPNNDRLSDDQRAHQDEINAAKAMQELHAFFDGGGILDPKNPYRTKEEQLFIHDIRMQNADKSQLHQAYTMWAVGIGLTAWGAWIDDISRMRAGALTFSIGSSKYYAALHPNSMRSSKSPFDVLHPE